MQRARGDPDRCSAGDELVASAAGSTEVAPSGYVWFGDRRSGLSGCRPNTAEGLVDVPGLHGFRLGDRRFTLRSVPGTVGGSVDAVLDRVSAAMGMSADVEATGITVAGLPGRAKRLGGDTAWVGEHNGLLVIVTSDTAKRATPEDPVLWSSLTAGAT